MKRVITSLSLLLLLLCGAYAQEISQYEYWTDDDYASRSVVSSSGGNISLDVSTASLSAGIHFLNFRAKRSDEVWGNFYRYLYYIPTLQSLEVGSLNVEYWLDDDLTSVKSEAAGNGNVMLSVDISTLQPGVHYFNCTPKSSTGERGNSERYLFYVPLPQDQASVFPIKGYEYWLDDNYAAKGVNNSGSNGTLSISLDGLTSGVHYFNCRAFNERGEYGCPVRKMFYIPQTKVNNNASIAFAEYWLDDDYAKKVSLSGSNVQQTLSIDISGLSSGVHYFNYRAKDNEGCWGNITRQMFYIAHQANSVGSELMDYECWFDDDISNKTTGKAILANYVISMDFSGLQEGEHTFNFRAKNVLDQWTDIYTEVFTVPFDLAAPVTVVAKDTVIYYGDEIPQFEYSVTEGRLIGEPLLTTIATKESPIGTYPIEIASGTIENTNVTYVNGTLTIKKAPLTIKAGSYTKKQGDAMPDFVLSYEGLKNNETSEVLTKQPTVSCDATESSIPGEYTITVAGAEAQNYDITHVNGKLIVTAEARTLLSETSITAPAEAPEVDVKVKRTINANEWSTICLPFAMSATQVKAAFGDDVQLADFTGYMFNEAQETITLTFSTVTAIEANHPYVIKVTSAISEFTVDNVDIAPVEKPMVNKGTSRKPKAFIGTYVANTTIGNGCLFLSNNKFLYSLGTTKMKAFRAYFDFIDLLPDFEENYAETRIQMAFDDETTNVVELKDGRLEELKSCYNLKGQRVEKPVKKGLYIRNGKKVIIK